MPDLKNLLGTESLYAIKECLDSKASQTDLNTKVDKVSGKQLSTEDFTTALKTKLENVIGVGVEEITYANLKSKRNNSQLVAGQLYRITDYQCTTSTTNTSSAGHQFDIIVLALATNVLSEQAWATKHAGDTYFANNMLEAWKLWYCLNNDTTRFAWANSTNGKGVIYRMIDEFGNDIPYDFKNILFTKSGSYTNAYTFSYTETREGNTIKDASLLMNKSCYSNIMKEYINSNKHQLNFNVFYSTSTAFSCQRNTFGNACTHNTFDRNCQYNTFGNSCNINTFGNSCQYNTFGNACSNNTFGNSCTNNTFGNSCQRNTFGNNCNTNTFSNYCTYITFGNSSSTITYCRYNIIDNGCQYLYIYASGTASTSNQLQYVHIHSGVTGTSSSYKTITVDRNLSYTTDVYPIGSTEMFI